MADINITGHGSYRIESLSEAGAEWMRDNVTEAEDVTDTVVVAHISGTVCARDIACGASDEGLEVGINGVLYDGGY
jgi:hypothetical protein